ncbi:metal dependent phosphohydrolase [Thermosyntropha lipolytica DSM 11003]|uniref:Metal dependent phosphohydrolase n=1 Tax=Thermosyntropha lipolytica DSM 11003 TaxID=1123382 RepID=A0A1M5P985_9FIRM|nr:HD domain-containing protein [Thermosyntropha lipolytica]SHG98340.1 metal dependent phosphohydrolase [Thermosyntropha lipolytica DSM 11003]
MVTLKDVKENLLVKTFIQKGNEHLGQMGYTDHGFIHVSLVANRSREIMIKLGYDERTAELAGIAGYMHDLGNVVNRNGHSQSGALIAMEILRRMGMDPAEVAVIGAAIGNHDEGNGHPVNEVAAALILADKSHVHRNRVRNTDVSTFDIHDRVNYAVKESNLIVREKEKVITMQLTIDTSICPVMEYFEIFLSRMLMCRRAADFLGCQFELIINGAKLL